MKKKITLNYSKSAAMSFCSKGLKNECETSVVNGPSVCKPPKFYCNMSSVKPPSKNGQKHGQSALDISNINSSNYPLISKSIIQTLFQFHLTLLYSECPKLNRVLAVLSAIGLNFNSSYLRILVSQSKFSVTRKFTLRYQQFGMSFNFEISRVGCILIEIISYLRTIVKCLHRWSSILVTNVLMSEQNTLMLILLEVHDIYSRAFISCYLSVVYFDLHVQFSPLSFVSCVETEYTRGPDIQ